MSKVSAAIFWDWKLLYVAAMLGVEKAPDIGAPFAA